MKVVRRYPFLLALLSLVTPLHAQAPAAEPTSAQLRARVAALEQELERVQRDFALLLTTCRTPAGSSEADRLAQAAQALQAAQLEADNRAIQRRQEEELENASWYVKSVEYGATEVNNVFIRFGWTVTIKNGISRSQVFDLDVKFLDGNRLVIETDHEYRQRIDAFEEKTISGSTLIGMPEALNVSAVEAAATRKTQSPTVSTDERR